MQQIDRGEYNKRLERINDLFTRMSHHADKQAQVRCPYKDRFEQCTAKFPCRNQRKPRVDGELPVCACDDNLDYRSAWESEPESYEAVKKQLNTSRPVGPDGSMASVGFQRRKCQISIGQNLFDAADKLGVPVATSCGRTGHCHECVVEITQGSDALGQPTEAETFLKPPFRLACQAVVAESQPDVTFSVLRRTPKILSTQQYRSVNLDSPVTRRGERVYYEDEAIDTYRGQLLGMAIDVGTTTMVAELVNLETGQPLYQSAWENPQRFGGSDIMHRISYDVAPFAGELHQAIINSTNREIRDMCRKLGVERQMIYEIVVVGNATMRDLFFGLDVQSIGQKPYKSLIEHDYLEGRRTTTALNESARGLRLCVNKNARVFGGPLVASHVGADVTADLLAIDILEQTEPVMLVDAGTNTEVVIGHRDRLMAASCPAGPAFEGGLVTFGMPGCDGAIESINYDGERFRYETIGGGPPQGICGSGLIDLLAQLRRHDLMTPKGVFAHKARELSIVPEQQITFSRRDASELAQAKAANYCGQMMLMRTFGITPDQISRLYLAGGFANYVNVDSAIEIGFLAPVPPERIIKVGNAAAQGAREMLISSTRRRAMDQLVQSIEHIELETMSDFFELFVEGCQMKPMPCV